MGDSDWRPFIYGGLASIVAEFGTFPIDTTKTRLQIQGQKIDPRHVELRYTGMVDCFVKTSRQEGVKALYWTIKFGTYYSMKKYLAQFRADGGSIEHVPTNTFCAAFAGGLSSGYVFILQVGDEKRNLVRCFIDIYRIEGARGLWRGVGPTSQRAAVIAAVELPVYDACKKNLMLTLGDTPLNHFVSSLVASLGSAVASTPLDVIRTYGYAIFFVDNYMFCKVVVHCFTVRNEGFLALYKGFIPTWLRMGPWNIIFFLTYEQLKQFY
ncbi:hypothetical protein K1T71_002253 [Dendrolimus kikuchii]|uniref:Uncharacterized protein n=1 Tax=Dendrolimus kikuchii TaxID=765133 RepID=A0ACC1DD51_9NEOP|nr:hypothetical protein K1T71_002253 [Dendrolimus kikuchii]